VRGTGGRALAPDDRLIGADVIGQYVVRRRLGSGAMGTVYLADQITIGRPAAIKVLHPHLSRDPVTAARFGVEARAASQLAHPNIVTIYNHGAMADGTLFLAMEYLAGRSLEQEAAGGPLPVARAAAIAAQIAAALGEAHRKGVVHRDVKPSNVMLTVRGEATDVVKVLDFGVAQIDGGGRMTATGFVCGTPRYMSPEQLRSKKLDGRSDLYSLACVLFELVTGRPPTAAAFVDQMFAALRPAALVPAAPPRRGTLSSLVAALGRAMTRISALRLPEKPSGARRLLARLSGRRPGGLRRLARRIWRAR
jgi:eukaryotic-like serine/threonine-protein kinase